MNVKPIDFGKYSPAYEGQVIWHWIDPPELLLSEVRDAVRACNKDPKDELSFAKLCALFAVMWSKHEDPETHWTPDEVEMFLCDQCYYQDPGLFKFIMQEIFELTLQELDINFGEVNH